MELDDVETLLRTAIGLSAASIGSSAIGRAVKERLLICKIGDLHAYVERVRASPTELQALIEAVVVPETWFFRDRHAYTALARLARETWLPGHPDGVMSLLSLPCSTGEEPYSMAMALLDAGVPAPRFRVDAVDISVRNLARGLRAVYGKNSFRGHELGFRDRHFEVTADGYRVKDTVSRQVHFQQGNLFAADLLPGAARYDVIFCRNLLIYFDRPTQDRALVVLKRLLHATGVLFVAPAETSLPGSHDLVSTHEPLAFAFRAASVLAPAPKAAAARFVAPRARVADAEKTIAVRSADLPADLDEAAALANHGHLVEAAASCEEHLRRCGPSAPALYLMGLVRDAAGNHAEAASLYRQALYLDPNHYDTQIHLALLMETQGDPEGAQVVRNRARRLEQTLAASHD